MHWLFVVITLIVGKVTVRYWQHARRTKGAGELTNGFLKMGGYGGLLGVPISPPFEMTESQSQPGRMSDVTDVRLRCCIQLAK